MAVEILGLFVLAIGVILLAVEFAHPGALLLIPGSILIVAGLLFALVPGVIDSPAGIILVAVVGIFACIVEVQIYRHYAPNHRPMTTTTAGLVGEHAVVIAEVVPDTLQGKVRVRSEVWSAKADQRIPIGSKVLVVAGEGVSLTVRPE